MDKNLIESYKSTNYVVPKLGLEIRIGVENPDLDEILRTMGETRWAFMTAWNPESKLLSKLENNKRNVSLRKELGNFEFYEGLGIPDEDGWAPEKSFFVLGISKNEANNLAKKYCQNAYLFGRGGEEAQLVITGP